MTDAERDGSPHDQVAKEDSQGMALGKPSTGRRVNRILIALLFGGVMPVVLVDVLVGGYGANAVLCGIVYGGLGAEVGGTRRMSHIAPGIGLAAGLAAFTGYDWWWVAVLAVAALVAGSGRRFGWFLPLLMVPRAATFASPVSTAQHAVVYGVITALGRVVRLALAHPFGAPEFIEGKRLPSGNAVAVAVVFGVAVGGAAAIRVALGWGEP